MSTNKAQFHFGLFYNAMVNLMQREPDQRYCLGWDGYYFIRYAPITKKEEKLFAENVKILMDWLSIFDIVPLESRCDYGRLLNPQKDEEGKDYLVIIIKQHVEKTKTEQN